jgi:hypothetical protein
MDTGHDAVPVTRREFYSALALVWAFIMLAFSTSVYNSRSPAPTNVIYLIAAFFMAASYSVISLRSGPSPRRAAVVAAILALVAFVVGAVAFFARTSH